MHKSYRVLKGLFGDLQVLRAKRLTTLSDWTTNRSAVDGEATQQLSNDTITLLNEAAKNLNKVDGPQSARNGLLSLSYVGENNYLRYVAGPLVDRILKVMEEKMASHTKEVQNVTSYMNAPVPSAYDGLKPDIMLTTLKKMHFVSVKVKADSSQLALAFDEALKAGFFLTPLTGYSAIIMAVAGTEVLMGLHTLLPHPTDTEETSPAASRGTGVWMQSARDSLPAMDATLQGELVSLSMNDMGKRLNILREYKSSVYPLFFDFDHIADRSTFEIVFSQYLQYLVDPICFGILSGAASGATFVEKSNKDCHVVICHKSLADKYRLPGCPGQFVAKLGVVRGLTFPHIIHPIFGCEVYGHAYHHFTITTKATSQSTASPTDRNPAVAAVSKQSDAERKSASNPSASITHTAGVQGTKRTMLITYIYRKFEGQSLDSMPSIAQFVDLMGALIVLHDKEGVYHCDVRRPNIIVKGDSLRLIDYEYCLESQTLDKSKKAVPLQLQGIRTAKFFSDKILKNNTKGACSFTERRYVQLLDICSLFYFVGGVEGNVVLDRVPDRFFSNKFNKQFCSFIAREKLKRTKKLRTTSEILQDILQPTQSQETPDWSAVTDEAKKRDWFDGISTYKEFCNSHLQTR